VQCGCKNSHCLNLKALSKHAIFRKKLYILRIIETKAMLRITVKTNKHTYERQRLVNSNEIYLDNEITQTKVPIC
jgi:hypothetical protein